ncbi:unnamed protein product [Mytilus coruscus]|uniref:Integrase catalytic domain-containing protein n=1 Tax=Mytilus coruscus TaxID=42192 RepID=A0A6J8CFK7_MYTCO|nr:unnamed protein product [Mytilus coruscus]
MWALGISGYNYKIEYISGTENTCVDLLSRAPSKNGHHSETSEIEIDINDKAFEVNTLNSNQFNPKHFASCKLFENKNDDVELTKTFGNFDIGWVEAFAVPSKESINIAHLCLEEIFPRFSCPLAVLTDNGSENKIKDNVQTWDLYLNQALAAIRFNVNESTKFSSYFLLYYKDPVLPTNNILKPRRKYYGEEHKIAIQKQHKSFVLKYLKRDKKRQAKYANKNAKEVKFKVGDLVYLKHHRKQNKRQANWRPYYRIIEKTSPVSFIVKNQLDGSITETHAEHLRPAVCIDEWEIPKDKNKRVIRATQYVISPDQTESENSSEHDSDNVPLIQTAKHFRIERQHSSSESDIPSMELSNKFKQKKLNFKYR